MSQQVLGGRPAIMTGAPFNAAQLSAATQQAAALRAQQQAAAAFSAAAAAAGRGQKGSYTCTTATRKSADHTWNELE